MGNSAQVDFSDETHLDIPADRYLAQFHTTRGDSHDGGTESFAVEARVSERIGLMSGLEPSYAIISIAIDDFPNDEAAFAVAFAKGGVQDRMRLNTRVTVGHVYEKGGTAKAILCGTLISLQPDAGNDAVVAHVVDDKWLLSRYGVFGQLQYDPRRVTDSETGMYTAGLGFVASAPCVFNQFGWPNCMDTAAGPVFAPYPRFGYTAEFSTEPEPGFAQLRARSWRVADAIQYLRTVHYGNRNGTSDWPGTGIVDYGQRLIPSQYITWPDMLGASLSTGTGDNRANRTLHDFSIEGMDLNSALNLIASRAGPFELYCIPGSFGGDNGNDVEAGLMDAGGLGIYATLKGVFDATVSGMTTAFNNSQAALNAYINTGEKNLKAAIANYEFDAGVTLTTGVRFNAPFANLKATMFGSTALNYQENAKQPLQALYQKMGEVLDGNPGRYQTPAVSGQSEIQFPQQSSYGSSLKSMLGGLQEGRSTLAFVALQNRRGGARLYVPGLTGADLESAMRGNGIVEGNIGESIKDYYHEVCVLGDPAVVERMVYTAIGSGDPAETGLEPAWTEEDETAAIAYANANGADADAFKEAMRLYPMVYAAYRINKDFNFLAGTKWADNFQFRARRHPKVRTTLVTGRNESEENPGNWVPRQIPVEYNSSGWKLATLYDNLDVLLDSGVVMLTALRDSADHPTWSGSYSNPSGWAAREIRMTLAIETDFRITGFAGKSLDPNETYARVHHDQGGHQVTTYIAPSKELDYVEWMRINSFPVGQQIPASYRSFPDKASPGNELFSDRPGNVGGPNASGRIIQHALARLEGLKRLKSNGVVKHKQFDPTFVPGVAFTGVQDSGVAFNGVIRTVIIEANNQDVSLELG